MSVIHGLKLFQISLNLLGLQLQNLTTDRAVVLCCLIYIISKIYLGLQRNNINNVTGKRRVNNS